MGGGTRVIAGGIDVSESKQLVSRDVISVLIPASALVTEGFVDVHLATPHGVTSRIRIPAISVQDNVQSSTQVALINKKVTEVEKKVTTLENRYPTRFAWSSAKLTGCIDVCSDPQHEPNVSIPVGTKVTVDLDAFTAVASKLDIAFAFSVKGSGDKSNPLVSNGKTIYKTLMGKVIDSTKHLVTVDGTELSTLIAEALREHGYIQNDISAVKVIAVVRLHTNVNSSAEWPVQRVDGELEIAIDRCVKCSETSIVECPCEQSPPKSAVQSDVSSPKAALPNSPSGADVPPNALPKF